MAFVLIRNTVFTMGGDDSYHTDGFGYCPELDIMLARDEDTGERVIFRGNDKAPLRMLSRGGPVVSHLPDGTVVTSTHSPDAKWVRVER